jgi:hypothetical protein
MSNSQVLEGTAVLLQGIAFAERKLRVIIEMEEPQDLEDFSDSLPDPPNTVRDQTHLEQLLLAGLASPKHEVTEETWEQIRQEVRSRHQAAPK